MFPMCSPRVFPLAPNNPICFAQIPPLLTYIGGPKGRNSILQKLNLLFWGANIVSFSFSDGPIKVAHCKNENKKK